MDDVREQVTVVLKDGRTLVFDGAYGFARSEMIFINSSDYKQLAGFNISAIDHWYTTQVEDLFKS